MTNPGNNVHLLATPGQAIIVMGVAGVGKSTLGAALAAELKVPFLEGDSFHPPENVHKMSAGIPLQDEDRWPWLNMLGLAIAARRQPAGVVAACSALKRSYRDRLRGVPVGLQTHKQQRLANDSPKAIAVAALQR